jgi:hypothetical protein
MKSETTAEERLRAMLFTTTLVVAVSAWSCRGPAAIDTRQATYG